MASFASSSEGDLASKDVESDVRIVQLGFLEEGRPLLGSTSDGENGDDNSDSTREQRRERMYSLGDWAEWDGGLVGGSPSWLAPCSVALANRALKCKSCGGARSLLLQIYAPTDDCEASFHRSIYVFYCKSAACSSKIKDRVAVFRGQLPKQNSFYPENPLEGRTDDKGGEGRFEGECHEPLISDSCFPEFDVVIDEEDEDAVACDDDDDDIDDGACGNLGESEEGADEDASLTQADLDKLASCGNAAVASMLDNKDPKFTAFQKRTAVHPDQCMRYDRGGNPSGFQAITFLLSPIFPGAINAVIARRSSFKFCRSSFTICGKIIR